MKILLLIITTLTFKNICFSQTENLDLNFGNRGFITTDFNSNMDVGRALAIQPDGKIIVAGYSDYSGGKMSDFALTRYNPEGDLDSSFGNNGKLLASIRKNQQYLHDGLFGIALQSDGKIVAVGYSEKYIPYTTPDEPDIDSIAISEFTIVRFLSNGEFDSGFGENGIVLYNIENNGIFRAVTIQPDGKILAAGDCYIGSMKQFVVFRFNSDGSLDNSFGNSGIVTNNVDKGYNNCWSLIIQPDGKILLAGDNGYSLISPFIIMRLNSDGTLDSSFNTDGVATISFGSKGDHCRSVLIQADGKIILSGYTFISTGDFDFALARLNPDGTMDKTFGADGKVTTNIIKKDESCSSVLQPDGKIIVVGNTSDNFNPSKIALVRYNNDGSLDNSFSDSGILISSTGIDDSNIAQDVMLQQNGNIVIAGYCEIKNNLDFILCRYISDNNHGKDDDWAPLGAKWYYGEAQAFSGDIDYVLYASEKDTTVKGQSCRKITKRHDFDCYARPDFELMYSKNDSVYYFDNQLDTFQLLYNFNAVKDDSWFFKFKDISSGRIDTVDIHVDSISSIQANSKTLKLLYVTYTIKFEDQNQHHQSKIIEKIGDVTFMFNFYPYKDIFCDMNYSKGIRCYEDGDLGNYHFPSQESCTYTYSVPLYPDTIKVENNYCESLNPSAIDTTMFYYRNDSLIIRNVKDEFCCPDMLKAAIHKQNANINIKVFNPGADCLCECSYGYTVKIYQPAGDIFFITINGESFTIKKSDLTTSVRTIDDNRIKIYPNPVNDFLYINSDIDVDEISIIDTYGRIVYKSGNFGEKIDLRTLSTGFYLVSIKSNNEIIQRKIIKE